MKFLLRVTLSEAKGLGSATGILRFAQNDRDAFAKSKESFNEYTQLRCYASSQGLTFDNR
jgi:hypothetical protein